MNAIRSSGIDELGYEIKECLSILSSREKLYGIMRDELVEIKDEYATPRRTKIEDIEYDQDVKISDPA